MKRRDRLFVVVGVLIWVAFAVGCVAIFLAMTSGRF